MWLWTTKKKQAEAEQHNLDEQKSRVEVVAHKRATKRAIAQTRKVNNNLNELLEKNGITLQIHIATGGKH